MILNEMTSSNLETAVAPGSPPEAGELYIRLDAEVRELGYEIVALDLFLQPKKLQLFLDLPAGSGKGITLDDCARAAKALDPILETAPEVEALFHGPYELEVSSPGIERPLRRKSDFARFNGTPARIQTFRPLTEAEIENADYGKKNPKQRNFFGILRGVEADRVLLGVALDASAEHAKKPKPGKKLKPVTETQIKIPLPLVAKARLEPELETTTKEEATS